MTKTILTIALSLLALSAQAITPEACSAERAAIQAEDARLGEQRARILRYASGAERAPAIDYASQRFACRGLRCEEELVSLHKRDFNAALDRLKVRAEAHNKACAN